MVILLYVKTIIVFDQVSRQKSSIKMHAKFKLNFKLEKQNYEHKFSARKTNFEQKFEQKFSARKTNFEQKFSAWKQTLRQTLAPENKL